MIIAFMILLPLVCSPFFWMTGRKHWKLRDIFTLCVVGATFLATIYAYTLAAEGRDLRLSLPGICGLGLNFRADGFRSLYAVITTFMWLMSTLFSRQYFMHSRHRNRYWFFYLVTLSATLGVFLSDDLFTTFVFFEIMSFSSYPWIAHDETPAALRAAQTYLAIAVLGGMVTLMGLFMAWQKLGVLTFEAFRAAQGDPSLTAPALLILFGFCVKAGMFPVHIWLPKAHPVAPAPASAILSGVLTKTGMFGVIGINMNYFLGKEEFGALLLALGLITMAVGAVEALFSVNLKRTLACSSVSQIGYILVGVASAVLLGKHDAIPAAGALVHMVNHSILKLTLFMAAGAIYVNTHKLDLNDIRGFGRGKPILHIVFLLGVLGLSGVPLFNGYISKTLIHEGLVEYIAEREGGAFLYQMAEWVFLAAAGITTAYMLKLYIAIFWQKHPTRQTEFEGMNGHYLTKRSSFALLVSAALIPILGMFPQYTVEKFEHMSQGFLNTHAPEGVHYFSLTNLQGGALTLAIGILVYLFYVRRRLYSAKDGYVTLGPAKFDLEDAVYRPLLMDIIPGAICSVCGLLDKTAENTCTMRWAPKAALAAARIMDEAFDKIAVLLSSTVLKVKHFNFARSAGDALITLGGKTLNLLVVLANLTFRRSHPITVDFVYVFAASRQDEDHEIARITRTVSFGLLLFAIGLVLTLFYLVSR